MPTSLGISISNQVIKYAKVEKNNDQIDVASLGLKFYDDIEKTIKQIVEETNSTNIPICINTLDENVAYYSVFALLNKNDTKRTISTEFEIMCSENHLNRNAYEGRYLIVNDISNKDRNKAIYFYENKTNLDQISSFFENGKVKNITPLSTSICNVAEIKKGENVIIVNIEDTTTITTILNQKVYNIDKIKLGMKEVIEKIAEKENSYSKAYEKCKNTTIYTMEAIYTEDSENKYLADIIPTLFNIVQQVKEIKEKYNRIDRILLTGLGTAVNNIELYFQEYFQDAKCEILKPFFAQNNNKINIKDYIEVNSAIGLALEELGYGFKSLNFKASNWKEELDTLLHSDLKSLEAFKKKNNNNKNSTKKGKISFNFDINMKDRFSKSEMWLVRGCTTALAVLIIYSIGSIFLQSKLEEKIKEVDSVIADTNTQIATVQADKSKVEQKTMDYENFKSELENANNDIQTKIGRKNEIPTLLNQIVYIIPKSVQLTKIQNTQTSDGKQHIVLSAQSSQYEQLAYFKAKIKNNGYLKNVTSTEGVKEGQYVVVTIEGDLP